MNNIEKFEGVNKPLILLFDDQSSIAALCKATRRSGTINHQLQQTLEQNNEFINDAFNDNSSINFNFIDSKSKEIVTDITTRIFNQWTIAFDRTDNDVTTLRSPNIVHKIGETIMSVGIKENSFDINNNERDQQRLAKVLSIKGPKYIKDWMDNKTINQWLDDQNFSSEEREKWQKYLSPAARRAMMDKTYEPIDSLNKIRSNLSFLTSNNIASELNWPLDKVNKYFTRSDRETIAINYLDNPKKALFLVKRNIDVLITKENLANSLNIPEEDTQIYLKQNIKHYYAQHNRKDPIKAIQKTDQLLKTVLSSTNLATELNISVEEAENLFSTDTRLRYALRGPYQALKNIKTIYNNLNTILTNESISEKLNISSSEVKTIFTDGIIRDIAMSNPNDPLTVIARVYNNFTIKLTNENISKILGISPEEAAKIFTPKNKRQIAYHASQDVNKGCRDFINKQKLFI